jgi:hypothetical protein
VLWARVVERLIGQLGLQRQQRVVRQFGVGQRRVGIAERRRIRRFRLWRRFAFRQRFRRFGFR